MLPDVPMKEQLHEVHGEHVALIALTKRVGGVWKSHLMIEADFSTLVTPDSDRLCTIA